MQEAWYREHRARQLFARLNHPWMWIVQSNGLRRSAQCLWEQRVAHKDDDVIAHMDHHKAALMLGGMSIECAIKAQWLTRPLTILFALLRARARGPPLGRRFRSGRRGAMGSLRREPIETAGRGAPRQSFSAPSRARARRGAPIPDRGFIF